MDTSRHIRHPISRRMLSASEGLAPSKPPPPACRPPSFSIPFPPKNWIPVPYSLKKLPQPQKPSLSLTEDWKRTAAFTHRCDPGCSKLTAKIQQNKPNGDEWDAVGAKTTLKLFSGNPEIDGVWGKWIGFVLSLSLSVKCVCVCVSPRGLG